MAVSIDDLRGVTILAHGAEGYLRVVAPATLDHEEHAPIEVAPGTYRVIAVSWMGSKTRSRGADAAGTATIDGKSPMARQRR